MAPAVTESLFVSSGTATGDRVSVCRRRIEPSTEPDSGESVAVEAEREIGDGTSVTAEGLSHLLEAFGVPELQFGGIAARGEDGAIPSEGEAADVTDDAFEGGTTFCDLAEAKGV